MIQSGIFWLVLALSVPVFWVLPKRFRFGFLALASFGYLATVEPLSVLALLGWSLVFYWLAPRAATPGPYAPRILAALILGILGYLAYFKYVPRLVAALSLDSVERQLIIPLGISYFTFKFIHYAIEVARGNIRNRSPQQFFSYVFLFPIFTAGPIERFDHFLDNQEDKPRLRSMVVGLTRIVHGLVKKLVLVEMLLVPCFRGVTDAPILLQWLHEHAAYKVWGFLILTYVYMYLDFSAYSDMAIGASRLFGIRVMENFNLPIVARNIGEFWQRWHMTLAQWCRDYVYWPALRLTRSTYAAVYATFLAMGLWHAGHINWICWGLYQGTGVAVYLTWAKVKRRRRWLFLNHGLWQYAGIPITFLFVCAGLAFTLDGTSLYDSVRILAKLFAINLPA